MTTFPVNVADSDYGNCPTDNSPLLYGSKCCPNYLRKTDPGCTGTGGIVSTDPTECCDGTPVIISLK